VARRPARASHLGGGVHRVPAAWACPYWACPPWACPYWACPPWSGPRVGTHALSVAQLRPNDNAGLLGRRPCSAGGVVLAAAPGLRSIRARRVVRRRRAGPSRRPSLRSVVLPAGRDCGARIQARKRSLSLNRRSLPHTKTSAPPRTGRTRLPWPGRRRRCGDPVARHRQPHSVHAPPLPAQRDPHELGPTQILQVSAERFDPGIGWSDGRRPKRCQVGPVFVAGSRWMARTSRSCR